jgi:hypothetical protein
LNCKLEEVCERGNEDRENLFLVLKRSSSECTNGLKAKIVGGLDVFERKDIIEC